MPRGIDLSLFRGDDSDEDDGSHAVAPAELNALKSKTFSYGVTKKTKRDLELEAERKKQAEEEEATKLALAEFSSAFSGPSRGLSVNRGPWKNQTRGFVRAGETTVYNPRRDAVATEPEATSRSAPTVKLPSPPPPLKPRGKRAMDAFLEEIKGNQEAREARLRNVAQREGKSVSAIAAYESSGGKRHNDQETTNLFVVNLPSSVTEAGLGNLFAKMGPVGTVKVMWRKYPNTSRLELTASARGDDEYGAPSTFRRTKLAGLTGFVCFMKRTDAEKAIRQYDGYEYGGSTLRVSWSKPAPIPRQAAFEPRPARLRSTSPLRHRPRSRSGSPVAKKRRSASPTGSEHPHARHYWLDSVSEKQSEFLQAVVQRINMHGDGIKDVLMERERNNPQFAFLFDEELPTYHAFRYYQDSDYRFPDPPRRIFEDDGYASIFSSDSAEGLEQDEEIKSALGPLALRRFEAILRGMTGKRAEIARAMEFAVKRADAADEVVDIIIKSLCIDSTPIPRKIARLHLISDILHNSASPLPNVWRYRQAFEKRLPIVFVHILDVYERLLAYSGAIAAAVFRQQVDLVLEVWERWMVFTSDVHGNLKGLLHGLITLEDLNKPVEPVSEEPAPQPKFKTAGFKSSFKRVGAAESAAVPGGVVNTDEAVGRPGSAADNTQVHQDDVDGETMEDLDGDPVDDAAVVDSEPMDDEDNLDGEAMGEADNEEDLDREELQTI